MEPNATEAIHNALAQLGGLEIHFPARICFYEGGGTIADGTVLVGAGRNAAIIRALQPSAVLFDAYGWGGDLRGFKFDAAVTRTGSSHISATATHPCG